MTIFYKSFSPVCELTKKYELHATASKGTILAQFTFLSFEPVTLKVSKNWRIFHRAVMEPVLKGELQLSSTELLVPLLLNLNSCPMVGRILLLQRKKRLRSKLRRLINWKHVMQFSGGYRPDKVNNNVRKWVLFTHSLTRQQHLKRNSHT